MEQCGHLVSCETCRNRTNLLNTCTPPIPVDYRFRHSSYLPSDMERSQLAVTLREELEMLERCKEEITVMEEKLERLRAREQALNDNIRTCRSALSAQRRIPAEVWELVFSFLCLSLHKYSLEINYNPKSRYHQRGPVQEMPALRLTQVCSRWRDVTIGSPRLWSPVSIGFVDLDCDIDKLLDIHFTNAKTYPLSIHLVRSTTRTSDSPFPSLSKQARAAWQVLSRHISRCRSLIMRVSRFDFQEIKDLSFPDLESFVEEKYLHDTKIEDILWFWQAIREAPKLTRVSSWSVNRMLPYSQLTWLELRSVDEDDLRLLFEVLPSCTRLQSLELWIFCLNGGAEPISLETVEISSLRELAVRELNRYNILDDDPILEALFTSLAMPSLASFTLSCCGWPESLSTLAKRSPLLRRVQLNNPDIDDVDISSTIDSLNSFLYSLPHLMQLELHMTTWKTSSCVLSDGLVSTLLSGLRSYPNRPSHLPKLDTIRLRLPDVTLDTKVVEEVLEVVKHRHSESSPMKQISVHRHGEKVLLQPATVGRIREVELACDAKIVIKEWMEGEGLWMSDSTSDSTRGGD